MANKAKQLQLFGPSLNVTSRLKAAMRDAIRDCQYSREQIVDRMKMIASVEGLGGGRGTTITSDNLDAWCSETKPNIIPLTLLPIFCKVTGDVHAIGILAAPLEAQVINPKEMNLLKWAKVEVQARSLAKARKKLLSEIEGALDE